MQEHSYLKILKLPSGKYYYKRHELNSIIYLTLYFKNNNHGVIFLIFYSVTFVSCDTGMMGQLIKMEVLKKLEAEHGTDVFRNDNLVLSATHTHSGPAGYMQYLMYTISSFGFVEDCFQVILIYITFLRFHQ